MALISNGLHFKLPSRYTCFLAALLLLVANKANSQHNQEPRYHIKAQFAGDIGLVAAGVGKEMLNQKLDADVLLGYLPESIGGETFWTTALKLAYVPFQTLPAGDLDWQPFRTGLQLAYTFGDDYFAFEPRDQYPKGYYGFSTALHLYYFLGGELVLARVNHLENVGVYYEVGALGKYLLSYVTNPRYLSPGKTFHLALGVKFSL